eukprot:2689881-Pleurochrysis_carterae.AAC.2
MFAPVLVILKTASLSRPTAAKALQMLVDLLRRARHKEPLGLPSCCATAVACPFIHRWQADDALKPIAEVAQSKAELELGLANGKLAVDPAHHRSAGRVLCVQLEDTIPNPRGKVANAISQLLAHSLFIQHRQLSCLLDPALALRNQRKERPQLVLPLRLDGGRRRQGVTNMVKQANGT